MTTNENFSPTILEFIRASQLVPEDSQDFNQYMLVAIRTAEAIWADRAVSYNVDQQSYEEMAFGALSVASELFKRVSRMRNLLTPARTEPLREEELARLIDTCVDTINYAAWQYALIRVAVDRLKSSVRPDTVLTRSVIVPRAVSHELEDGDRG